MKRLFGKKIYILAFFALLLNTVIFLAAGYLVKEYDAVKSDLDEVNKQLAIYDKRFANLQNVQKSLTATADDRVLVRSVFLSNGTIINFIEGLEYLAQKSGVRIDLKNVFYSGHSGENAVFSMVVYGKFPDVYRFVYLVEREKYMTGIGRISFSVENEKEFEWSAEINLKVLAYED
jgi:CRISPR/Cas system CSM-associated protein Csm3 (group 7 of RAMP superfamily)